MGAAGDAGPQGGLWSCANVFAHGHRDGSAARTGPPDPRDTARSFDTCAHCGSGRNTSCRTGDRRAIPPARSTPAAVVTDAPPAAGPLVRTVHVACANPGDEMVVPAGRVKIRYTCSAREQVVRNVQLSNGETLRIIATRSPHEYVRNRPPRTAQAAPPASGRAAPGGTGPRGGGGMPEGYRAAWDDDRLNPPNRGGPRTAAGDAQMAAVWDDSVPMQRVAPGAAASTTTVSTMSAPPRRNAEVGTDARFIQAASFADPANAQRTAQRIARLGLPVRMVKVTRGGQALRLVQAGPFADGAALTRALGKVRGGLGGFADAYAVR